MSCSFECLSHQLLNVETDEANILKNRLLAKLKLRIGGIHFVSSNPFFQSYHLRETTKINLNQILQSGSSSGAA